MEQKNNEEKGSEKRPIETLVSKPKPDDYEYDNEIDWEEYYEESENYELEHGGLR